MAFPQNEANDREIVAVAVACSSDWVYAWYSDRFVSAGTSDDLDRFRTPHLYDLPEGKSPENIVGAAIAGDDHVYMWFDDNEVSSGTSDQLYRFREPYPYVPPSGFSNQEIAGMGIACSNDHVYTWLDSGWVSSGTTKQLDAHLSPYPYSVEFDLPVVVDDLTAEAIDDSIAGPAIHLEWTDTECEGHYLLHDLTTGSFSEWDTDEYPKSLSGDKVTIFSTGHEPNTEYCFEVMAINEGGTNGWSIPACATTFP